MRSQRRAGRAGRLRGVLPALALLVALPGPGARAAPVDPGADPGKPIGQLAGQGIRPVDQMLQRARRHLALGQLVLAADALEQALQEKPEDAAVALSLAQLQNQLGRPDRAAELARAVLARDPQRGDARLVLGAAELGRGDAVKARAALEPHVKASPADPAGHELLAGVWLRQGDKQHALEEFGRALGADPNRVGALVASATLEQELGHGDRAMDLASRAVQIAPESASASIVLAGVYRSARQFELAEAHYRTAISLAPEHIHGYDQLAALYAEAGRADREIETIESLLRRSPDQPRAYRELARAHAAAGRPGAEKCALAAAARLEGKRDEAQSLQRAALELAPALVAAHLEGAEQALARGDADGAVAQASIAVGRAPRSEPALLVLARAREAKNDTAGAEAELRKAVAAEPESPESQAALAGLLRRSGRCSDALPVYVRALELRPTSPALHRELADCRASAGESLKAEDEYSRALALDPRDARALVGLAWVYLRAERNVRTSLFLTRQASAFRPDDPATLHALGAAQYQAGELQNARASLERALQRGPTPEEAAQARDLLGRIERSAAR